MMILTAPAFAAKIVGTSGADILVGNADVPDTITALGGNDTITFLGHNGWDRIHCGAGSDTLDYSLLVIDEPTGVDLAQKAAYNSIVLACENIIGTDSLLGDRLDGDGKRNRIQGGLGPDVINGRAGADTFVYTRPEDSTPDLPDLIKGFGAKQGDRIDLSALANESVRLSYVGQSDFSGAPGEVRFEPTTIGSGKVLIDLDGDLAADVEIRLSGKVRGALKRSMVLPSKALILK